MQMTVLSQPVNWKIRIVNLFWQCLDWLYPPSCCHCAQSGSILCPECISQIQQLTPPMCRICGYPIQKGKTLCEGCRNSAPEFTAMRSWAAFDGPLKKAIHAYKYQQNLAFGYLLAIPLAEMVKQSGWEIDVVVPVPLSRRRKRERGYNQAGIIAWHMAKFLDLPYSGNALTRVRHTETQISLDVNKRFMNLMDAFNAKPATLKNRKVLIVDDVITTQATMQGCTQALRLAGVQSIYCVSVARAILRHPRKRSIESSNPFYQPGGYDGSKS